MKVDSFLAEASGRDSDEFFVQDQGWYTKQEYADLTGKESGIFPLCGPDTPAHP